MIKLRLLTCVVDHRDEVIVPEFSQILEMDKELLKRDRIIEVMNDPMAEHAPDHMNTALEAASMVTWRYVRMALRDWARRA